jgi:hypothetical protein
VSRTWMVREQADQRPKANPRPTPIHRGGGLRSTGQRPETTRINAEPLRGLSHDKHLIIQIKQALLRLLPRTLP